MTLAHPAYATPEAWAAFVARITERTKSNA